jgi:protein gp37
MTSDHLKYDEVINCRDSWNGDTILVESALKKPLGWKKPRAIFVNSMGDLFHENTDPMHFARVFSVIEQCPQHLFIILTKRAERMKRMMSPEIWLRPESIPFKNVWLGVTAENQAAADERIPHLLNTPAAVRFVSCEPLIGEVSLRWAKWHDFTDRTPGYSHDHLDGARDLDWIICGGESGPGARAMNPEWARSLSNQSAAAGVPFFFKQWGDAVWNKPQFSAPNAGWNSKEKHGGDLLGKRKWYEWPEASK